MSTPTQQECGFSGLDTTVLVSEDELRETIRSVAKAEREHWLDATGHAIDEQADTQVGHLVRYWLAGMTDIWPSTLTALQANAIASTLDYGIIPGKSASTDDINDWVDSVRTQLLVGVSIGGDSAVLDACIAKALLGARDSHLGKEEGAWSAVFVVSCVRQVAIAHELEWDSGGSHEGRDGLLVAAVGHRFYVQGAYKRSFGAGKIDGTYQAFCPAAASCAEHASCPDGRAVQVGDIIVQDRTKPIASINDVDNFCDIQDPSFLNPNPQHGDIVVEVTAGEAVTIGGNLQSGSATDTGAVYSARRRRYPLQADGTLLVASAKLFTQEDDSGDLPPFPPDDPSTEVNLKSTGRIFALLSPVPHCATPASDA